MYDRCTKSIIEQVKIVESEPLDSANIATVAILVLIFYKYPSTRHHRHQIHKNMQNRDHAVLPDLCPSRSRKGLCVCVPVTVAEHQREHCS